ncbi:MAG: alpha/beta hydrolase [Bacteroidota bacterium]|nr:alpha/beta hydrolase [Bacteroidota bacterium]
MKIIILLSILFLSFEISFSQTPKKAEVVSLQGVKIYYEVYGKGAPLILLHGYTGSSKHWAPYVSDYANDFEVYLIDLKGHGKSGPFKETLSIKSAANDVDALIKHLKLKSVNAIGFSYGGDVLFQLALLHPGLIKSMISIGACGTWNARDYPDWIESLSYKNINNLKWMREQQMNEAQSKAILDEFPNYNVSVNDEEMKSIEAKTLFILGDQDTSIPLECISSARKNLPESYLWILPNTGHGAHEGKNKQEFISVSKEFFREQWKK